MARSSKTFRSSDCSDTTLGPLFRTRPHRLRSHVRLCSHRPPVRRQINAFTSAPKKFVQKRSSRFIVYAVLLVVALSIPHIVTQSYWMYLIVEQVLVWILLAEGLNVVVDSPAARLGLRRLLRDWCLHHGVVDGRLAGAASLSSRHPHVVGDPHRGRRGHGRRYLARHSHASPARRLLGHRDARLRSHHRRLRG